MATYFYDFATYGTGVLGTDWAELYDVTGAWTAKVYTDGTATGGKVVKLESNGGGSGWFSVYNSTVGAQSGDLEIVARVKVASSVDSNGYPFGIALLSVSDTGRAYGPMPYFTDWYGQYFQSRGAWSNLGGPYSTVSPAADSYFWIRYGRSGTTIRGKFWTGANTDEPGSWSVSATNSTIADLYAGFATYARDYTIDVFGIGTAGSTAPTSDASAGGGIPKIMQAHARRRR